MLLIFSDGRKLNNRSKYPSSDDSEEDSSDSAAEKSTKKRRRTEKSSKKRRSSSESDTERRVSSKIRRSISPVVVDERRSKSHNRDNRDKPKSKETNGQHDKNHSRIRRRSRSPVKRRSSSPPPTSRKDKYYREREKTRSKDKYSSKSRR